MSPIGSEIIEAPAHWANYFINNNTDGMNNTEISAADDWANAQDGVIVDCGDETFIGNFNGKICEMMEYTFHYYSELR